jgi:hypothetical protein
MSIGVIASLLIGCCLLFVLLFFVAVLVLVVVVMPIGSGEVWVYLWVEDRFQIKFRIQKFAELSKLKKGNVNGKFQEIVNLKQISELEIFPFGTFQNYKIKEIFQKLKISDLQLFRIGKIQN